MAVLDDLKALIYHERQQEGSMLCAQHAVNSLLQENYFTAPDLSDLARNLDLAEQSYSDRFQGGGSMNMDDTGFFSVQVLESALNLWGLSLVRWRSEAMRPHQSKPHLQLAFILNQNQHWYTLRRFGLAADHGHWFNLDSSEPRPRWIGRTYLDIFLQQAEQDGYSVFVVTPTNPGTDLPRTRADELAASIPESTSAQPSSSSPSRSSTLQKASDVVTMEDEDMDLQAALQASLIHPASSTSQPFPRPGAYPAPHIPTTRDILGIHSDRELAASSRSRVHPSGSTIPPNQDPYGHADIDPVTASMERNRIIMERMRREQEMALREQYEEEVSGLRVPPQPGHYGASEEEGEEEEHVRRAIEASLAGSHSEPVVDDDDDDDDYQPTPPPVPTHRVYDDDDEALQAALKASLETMPPGFVLPAGPGPRPIERFIVPLPAEASVSERETVETAPLVEDDISHTESESDAPREEEEKELSLEEIRRRRLARFGG